MTHALFRATRALPIREQQPGTYQCARCGIQRVTRPSRQQTHCMDCRPYKEASA